MRSSISIPLILLAFLALVIPRSSHVDAAGFKLSPEAMCRGKNAFMAQAVKKFCNRNNLVAPSEFSRNGVYSPNRVASVRINGNCSPSQWIPQKYCLSQFWDLCIRGDGNGQNAGRYGKNGCQYWETSAESNGKSNKKPKKGLGG